MGSLRGLEKEAVSQGCTVRQDILIKHRLLCRTPRGWMSVQEGKVTGKSEDAWSMWGRELENLTGGEEQSQVVANGKGTHPGDDHLQPLPAAPQASNACVMGNRSYGFGVTPTASLGPLS